MRVDRASELLGARSHGPIHASACCLRRALRHRHGRGRLPHVQRGHSRAGCTTISQHVSRSAVRRAPMEGESSDLEIDEIKTAPHVPLSHPFVERLIGTMRREFLDQVLFWNADDLERKLAEFY